MAPCRLRAFTMRKSSRHLNSGRRAVNSEIVTASPVLRALSSFVLGKAGRDMVVLPSRAADSSDRAGSFALNCQGKIATGVPVQRAPAVPVRGAIIQILFTGLEGNQGSHTQWERSRRASLAIVGAFHGGAPFFAQAIPGGTTPGWPEVTGETLHDAVSIEHIAASSRLH